MTGRVQTINSVRLPNDFTQSTIKDKYIEPHNRQYTKQWFQVNVKQVRNGRLLYDQVWSFMQMSNGKWGYNPYPLLSMDDRAAAIFNVAVQYR